MSNVTLNHIDQDLIELEITQHGQNYSECMLKDELLDGKKSYHFCVNSLSVPMRNAPIHPVTVDTTLFTIERRVQGINQSTWSSFYSAVSAAATDQIALNEQDGPGIDVYADGFNVVPGVNDAATLLAVLQFIALKLSIQQNQTALQLITAIRGEGTFNNVVSTYVISPSRPQFSVAEFVQEIQQAVEVFNRNVTRTGIMGVRHGLAAAYNSPPVVIVNAGDVNTWFSLETNCDSALLFKPGGRIIAANQPSAGTKYFSNYFFIKLSAYGAALLGLPLVDLQKKANNIYYLVATGDSYSIAAEDNNERFIAAANTQNVQFSSRYPVYSTADQRVKISVGSHLPITSNVAIKNELQTSDRDISEAFFENEVTSVVSYDGANFDTQLVSRVYSGQCNMIKKYSTHHQWNRLLTSYQLRYLRFYIFITYREYLLANDTFVTVKKPLAIEPHEYWVMGIKFVSDV